MSERIILDEVATRRTITRTIHEILEHGKGTRGLTLLGIKTRGAFLAYRIQDKVNSIEQQLVPTGTIDTTCFRDDVDRVVQQADQYAPDINVDINNKVIVIIDDVLYTGCTVRASLDTILLHTRPTKIGFVALVDRGHRELPTRVDFVGKNIPTTRDGSVSVYLEEIDDRNAVVTK